MDSSKSKIMAFYRQNLFFCNFLLAWLLLFSLLRTLQHFSFATSACDLSLFDYAISSTLKGQIMAEPFHSYGWGSHLAIHFTPILFFLVPFYIVLKGPLFLLYIQVLAVGFAAIPLYLLAREKLGGKYPALVVAVSYLLFRPLLNGLIYDFHPEMFFPLFIFSGHYYLTIRKNNFLFFLFIILALFIKEDFAIYVFFYCLWMLHSPEQRKIGMRAAIASAIYVTLAFAFFIPHFRSQINAPSTYEFMSKWQDYGNNIKQIARQFLAHPRRLLRDLKLLANLASLANYFLPLVLIPLFDPIILLILPPLLTGWLSRIPLMSSFGLYYGAALLTFLFLALLQALTRLKQNKDKNATREKVKLAWILNLLLIFSLVNFKWNLFVPAKYLNIRDYPAVRDCLKLIPAQASLAAQSAIIPHIPKRKAIFMLPTTGQAEFILLHLQLNPWPLQSAQLHELDTRLQSSTKYSCLYSSGDLHLYKKNSVETMVNTGGKK
jgi:uncharacterized membrane protein